MTWSDIPFQPTQKALRQFAGGCLVIFPAIGAFQYFARHHTTAGTILIAVGLVMGLTGLIFPRALKWIFVGWMVAAFPVGWTISQIMLLLMFFCLITPVALFFRLRGRDLLRRKTSPGENTFWSPKEMPRDVRRYFCQY